MPRVLPDSDDSEDDANLSVLSSSSAPADSTPPVSRSAGGPVRTQTPRRRAPATLPRTRRASSVNETPQQRRARLAADAVTRVARGQATIESLSANEIAAIRNEAPHAGKITVLRDTPCPSGQVQLCLDLTPRELQQWQQRLVNARLQFGPPPSGYTAERPFVVCMQPCIRAKIWGYPVSFYRPYLRKTNCCVSCDLAHRSCSNAVATKELQDTLKARRRLAGPNVPQISLGDLPAPLSGDALLSVMANTEVVNPSLPSGTLPAYSSAVHSPRPSQTVTDSFLSGASGQDVTLSLPAPPSSDRAVTPTPAGSSSFENSDTLRTHSLTLPSGNADVTHLNEDNSLSPFALGESTSPSAGRPSTSPVWPDVSPAASDFINRSSAWQREALHCLIRGLDYPSSLPRSRRGLIKKAVNNFLRRTRH
ncbi:hypothetical protein PYCC9005_005565 [Savitreella phatthalungensis]